MKRILAPILSAALTSIAFIASAADVPVPPPGTNTISGLVGFSNVDADILARLGPPGGEGISSFTIFASTEPPNLLQSSKSWLTADPLINPYEITVAASDVPLVYRVYGYLVLDENQEEYWTATQSSAPLTSNSPPATVNLDECVALLELRYVDSAGQPVTATGGRALVKETGTGYWRARYLAQPPGRTGNYLVVPSGVEIEIEVEVDTGSDLYSDRITHLERHTMTLGCDDRLVLTITIPDPVALGKITGNANVVDEIELPTGGYLELLGRPVIKARGPSGNQRYDSLAAELPGMDMSRPFELENLVPSNATEKWDVYAEMHFRSGHRFEYFISPGLGRGTINPGVEVTSGETTDLGDTFVMTPAVLTGSITLTGPPEFDGRISALRGLVRSADYDSDMDGIPDDVGIAGIGGSYVIASGVDELAPGATLTTAGGQATASFEGAFSPATSSFEGRYEAVVGMLNNQPGVWKYDGLNINIEHPGTNGGPFVSEQIYIFEDFPWRGALAPGERATNNVRYGFAEVCLRLRSPAPFFYPRVINSYGSLEGVDSENNLRSYRALLYNASAPPYTADTATNEAIVTMYLPEGTYTLQPAFSLPDADGGVSEVQLPPLEISVIAGERLCVEDCLRIVLTGPACTANTGFVTFADAFSCDSTLTNLSLTTRSLDFPGARLGYSDIRILEPAGTPRATLRTAHGLWPQFDGFPREYYSNLVITAEARDTRGRVFTRQIFPHYDFTPPTLGCPPDITTTSSDGASVPVEYAVSASSDGILQCEPPSGSLFPVGFTPVNCAVRDLCYNTNNCAFRVIVRGTNEPCDSISLRIALAQAEPPIITLTWDCFGILESAPEVDGPWTDVADAISPHPLAVTPERKFFRVRQAAP